MVRLSPTGHCHFVWIRGHLLHISKQRRKTTESCKGGLVRIRKTKKPRTKHAFSFPKIKTVLLVHVRYTIIQFVLGLIIVYFLKTKNPGPLEFTLMSIIICGFYGFPMWTTKSINRLIRQNEYTGIWGNWLFQSSVCIGIIRFVIPFEQSNLWIQACAATFALSIIFLLFSIKRSSRKPFSNFAQ